MSNKACIPTFRPFGLMGWKPFGLMGWKCHHIKKTMFAWPVAPSMGNGLPFVVLRVAYSFSVPNVDNFLPMGYQIGNAMPLRSIRVFASSQGVVGARGGG